MNASIQRKLFNDPVYGFITVSDPFLLKLIEHPYFQRLRRISQNGFTNYVYPGCVHSRFLHALGCLHLMQKAVHTLRQKQIEITKEEERAVYIAILLHDIGHGPFSHALEATLVEGVSHEELSLRCMQSLNQEFSGELELALQMFQNKHPKKFLSQLISSQLDVDRLDYLKRDSFFTGVAEGNVNSDRIISMMNVNDNRLVIDAKGIYSVEKFLIARMFMYWEVYLHKTSFAVELYLISAFRRARELAQKGEMPFATSVVAHFLQRKTDQSFSAKDLSFFTQLDDSDLVYCLKQWQFSEDKILQTLARSIVCRRLPQAEIRNQEISMPELEKRKAFVADRLGEEAIPYFVHQTSLKIKPYTADKHPILLLQHNQSCMDLAHSPRQILTHSLSQETRKNHFCYWNERKWHNF